MLDLRFVQQVVRVLRLAHCRIEQVFLDLRVNGERLADRLHDLDLARRVGVFLAILVFVEQLLHFFVVVLEQVERVVAVGPEKVEHVPLPRLACDAPASRSA